MIRSSEPKFCVGISGDWGTGKTTLMKLIENILKPIQFNWEDIPTNDLACEKLKGSLRRKFDLNWLNSMQKFSKAADKKVLEPYDEATHNSLSFIINEDMTNVIMKINDDKYCELSAEYQNNGLIVRERDNNILTVWFNAWRYEKEDQLALIALMKTIAYALGEHAIYKKLKPILLRGIGIIGKDILRHFALEYAMTEKGIEELEKNLLPKMELLSKVDKDTIYFDGLNEIEKLMENILEEYHDSRIVVFIDDLDRCSPTKALEVLESIKVFLDIKGFVYVIGLSERTVEKLIDTAFKEAGVKGKEYLQKIIQLQVVVPQWYGSDIRDLTKHIHNKLGRKYSGIIWDNKDLIALAMESNPRQVKRFINRFIVSHENFVDQYNSNEFLVLEMLKERWSEFYKNMDTNDFITKVNTLLTKEDIERNKLLNELVARENDKDDPLDYSEKILSNFRSDTILWTFLKSCKEHNILFGLGELEIQLKVNIHRHASESVKEISDIIPVAN